jgi:hypothetical protein
MTHPPLTAVRPWGQGLKSLVYLIRMLILSPMNHLA